MPNEVGNPMGLIRQIKNVTSASGAEAPIGHMPVVPIAGVSLELFADISCWLAQRDHDETHGPELAAERGIGAEEWWTAVAGWNARILADPAIAREFNRLYSGRGEQR